MAGAKDRLTIRVYADFNKTVQNDDLSHLWTYLVFSTGLHGGFKDLRMSVPMPLSLSWLWLQREGAVGRHYNHIEVADATDVVWEGRVADIGLRINRSFVGIDITGFGYYSSLRDRYYDPDDAGNTNWKIGGPHNTGKIIREMITSVATAINGTVDIELSPEDVVGIDLTDRSYPMDIIVDKLAPLAGTGTAVYYFSVYGTRKPVWTARTVSNVDWQVRLEDMSDLSLVQQGMHLRNYVMPVVGTAEGATAINTASTALYPRREILLKLQTGVPTTAANNARDAMLQERKDPRQNQSFTVKGHIYSTKAGNLPQGTGSALEEKPKWWVRAGDVIRIQDLVPDSAATGTLDNLRTFYILETQYNAGQDTLLVQPDQPASRLGDILARLGTLEKQR